MPLQAGYLNDNDPWAGWTPLVRITRLVERNYGMFGSLFGVRNDYRFHPIAADRGLPSDLSMELEEWGPESGGPQGGQGGEPPGHIHRSGSKVWLVRSICQKVRLVLLSKDAPSQLSATVDLDFLKDRFEMILYGVR